MFHTSTKISKSVELVSVARNLELIPIFRGNVDRLKESQGLLKKFQRGNFD